jgi:hypothetical protein
MKGYKLVVRNLSNDQTGNASINCKPNFSYEVGQTFWAEAQGEKNGVVKLKRVKSPEGVAQRTAAPSNTKTAVPYEKALHVYRRFAEDLNVHEMATSMFIAWLRGDVADPLPEVAPDPGWEE